MHMYMYVHHGRKLLTVLCLLATLRQILVAIVKYMYVLGYKEIYYLIEFGMTVVVLGWKI